MTSDGRELLIAIIAITGIGYVLMAFVIYVQVLRMSRPEKACPPVTSKKSLRKLEQILGRWSGWDQEHGFVLGGNAEASGCVVVLWHHVSRPLYFTVIVKPDGAEILELETVLRDPQMILSTSNSPDNFLMPAPDGMFRQVFAGAYIEDLWDQHGQAEAFLLPRLNLDTVPAPRNAYEFMCDSTRGRISYVRSLPLWPLRWPYWFFLRRRLWRNRTIEQQLARGMIRIPQP